MEGAIPTGWENKGSRVWHRSQREAPVGWVGTRLGLRTVGEAAEVEAGY